MQQSPIGSLSQSQILKRLESAKEVGLPDSLSACISRALCDLGPLLETLCGLLQKGLGRLSAVIFGRGDVGSVVVDRNFRREEGSASAHLLLVTLALFLVQS